MTTNVSLKFKMLSANHKTVNFEQAVFNTDVYFLKHNGRIEVLGTENYRAEVEKQFLMQNEEFIRCEVDDEIKNDNITKLLLESGKKLAPDSFNFPNTLFNAISIGQKSALHVLQTNKELDINRIFHISDSLEGIELTAFEYAVVNNNLLAVNEMLKNHGADLGRICKVFGTILHLARTEPMIRLLMKPLKEKGLLNKVMKTKDFMGYYPDQTTAEYKQLNPDPQYETKSGPWQCNYCTAMNEPKLSNFLFSRHCEMCDQRHQPEPRPAALKNPKDYLQKEYRKYSFLKSMFRF